MNALRRRAELGKLARVMHIEAATLSNLDPLAEDDLRALRERIEARLFDQGRTLFQRVAAGSRLLPAGLNARISEKVFGPLLTARIAGCMPVDRAIDIASKLPVPFQADTTLHLDPRRTAPILRAMPLPITIAVSKVLVERREYVNMARFVDVLPDDVIRAVTASIRDDAALLCIGFYVESPQRLDELIRMLPDERLIGIVRAGIAGNAELRLFGLAMMSRVGDPLKKRLADIAVALGDDALESLVNTARVEQLWSALIPIVLHMGDASLERLFAIRSLREPAVVRELVAAVDQMGLWSRLLPLLDRIGVEEQAMLIREALGMGEDLVVHLLQAAGAAGLWPTLVGVLSRSDDAVRGAIAQGWRSLSADVRGALEADARKASLWEPLRAYLG